MWTISELPGSPVGRIQCFHCQALGSVRGQGTKILQAVQCNNKKMKYNF